ncbi:MAG: KUP/HAK/KT family potassium transporter [Bacteroidia bacterium]|nr:KUP/HAK/KT family potassium transporter [Bacteroidia bacterium]MDW8302009.1 KUP/HAK/KT family potassium transporter [Bacteroidia bacterium]
MESSRSTHIKRLSFVGLLVTVGIIFGDIGTSPLYVLKAIVGDKPIEKELILGALSCIFWTLTLQTTLKYVVLTLRADNNGEGGILSLYALVRKASKQWVVFPAMLGACALLADGIITPSISVSSAIEGLRVINPDIPTVPIVISIITALFIIQQFGTNVVGKTFGPVMLVWFSMLAVLGLVQVSKRLDIFWAINPKYAYNLLFHYPSGFWLLGAVFLCTTGAEALYSDLGHCGRANIRVSWIFVKTCLLINYFGQGAWLLDQGEVGHLLNNRNPFYEIMPRSFLPFGIIIATTAAIIASQALISGTFTLVSEAMKLNLWPKMRVNYPTELRGQIYIPAMNWLLWLGCIFVVLYFKESGNMEAAYGLSITLTMLMTTLLLAQYLYIKRRNLFFPFILLIVYLSIELSFLAANLLKFAEGGWITLLISGALFFIMWIWYKARLIKDKLTEFEDFEPVLKKMRELSNDSTIAKYATNLVYMSAAPDASKIEKKIVYSIFQKQPKRADIYWIIHIEVLDTPYTTEYAVEKLVEDDVYRITFYLGFRVEQRINILFRKVVEELERNREVNIMSRYHSLKDYVTGDFKFVVLERYLPDEKELTSLERFVMRTYFFLSHYLSISEGKAFGLDTSVLVIEKVPLVLPKLQDFYPNLKRRK